MSTDTFKIKFRPNEDQNKGISFLLERKEGLLLFAPGEGKSFCKIIICFKLLLAKAVRNCFIIGTKTSLPEIEADFYKLTHHRPFVVKTLKDLEKVKSLQGKIILLQYERLRGLPEDLAPSVFRESAILLDEVQKLKTPTSSLTNMWRCVRPYVKVCYGFTATAITSNLDDLYWIVNFVKPKCLGEFEVFRMTYYITVLKRVSRVRKINEIVGYKNLEHLYKRLDAFVYSFFPERDVRFIESYGEVSDPEKYKKAAKGILESTEPKAWAARMFDLQKVVDADINKLRLLAKEVKSRIGSGVIIYCSYYDAVGRVEWVLNKLKIPYKMIAGKLSQEERLKSKDWFNGSPEGKALIITNAGSTSVNLQSTNELILFNIPPGLGTFQQCSGRIVRMNSKYNHFNVVLIGLKGTVDEYKMKYIQLMGPVIRDLFNNKIIPPLTVTMHEYLKREFKDNLLWWRK